MRYVIVDFLRWDSLRDRLSYRFDGFVHLLLFCEI